jgi:RNA polymerase sigma-70 factor (ECF subfamily)
MAPYTELATVNGEPGTITVVNGRLMGVMGVTVVDGKITQIDILADVDRLKELPLSA